MSFHTYNGEIWSVTLADASLNPILDGQTTIPGHGSLIPDAWLDPSAGNIKSNFYGFYNRIQLTPGAGLSLSYAAANVLTPAGVVAIAPGTISVPASATSFIFVNPAGVITAASLLPSVCLPLAQVTTSASSITSFIDLRNQLIDRVDVLNLPAASATFQTGDLKQSLATSQPGWLLCDGSSYNISDYPALYAVIGQQFQYQGQPNPGVQSPGQPTTFRVPDLRGMVMMGAGNGFNLGNTAGSSSIVLSQSQLPSHNHPVQDNGHNHALNQTPHSHGTSDQGHSHIVYDPGHVHSLYPYREYSEGTGYKSVGAELTQIANPDGTNIYPNVASAQTGVAVGTSRSNVSVQSSNANATVASSTSGIVIGNTGGNQSISLIQPSFGVNFLIKV